MMNSEQVNRRKDKRKNESPNSIGDLIWHQQLPPPGVAPLVAVLSISFINGGRYDGHYHHTTIKIDRHIPKNKLNWILVYKGQSSCV
jgi:hypothetical protein